MTQNTHRIDAFGTDAVVLTAIFFLNWKGEATSITAISNYYQGDMLKPDAIKDSLKRLKSGGVLKEVTKRRGRSSVYKIKFAKINSYFALSKPSESTKYRGYRRLEKEGLVRYHEGKYNFDAIRFLDVLTSVDVNVDSFLKSLTDITSLIINRQIPSISRKDFIRIVNGHEISLDGPLISFNDNLLEICQKALSPSQI